MGTASAADITVNNSTGPVADFTSIQAAVDAAKDGDTIIVYSGIYMENVVVNKELTITSQSGNPEDTVMQGFGGENRIINITANNVTISGFKIAGDSVSETICLDGVQYNNINDNEFFGCAIDLRSSSNNTVSNNSCRQDFCCIGFSYSSNNLVIDNSFSGMEQAVILRNSDNNILTGNSMKTGEGAFWLVFSSNNTLSNNKIDYCWSPIRLSSSSNNNTVINNYVRSHEGPIGICSSSYNNLIYNNYFDISAISNADDDGNNSCNITKTLGTNIVGGPFLGGNYWSNYAGTDTDGDGLGDTLLPYGGDYLPLVKPAEPPAPAAIYTVNNSTGPAADFTSIQAAVDAAEDGDTIIVYSGIYTENVDVNKELTIISQSGNPEDTVVQALDDEDYIFNVTANYVTISGFKVGRSFKFGINLDGVRNNNISNNDASGDEHGICLNLSSNNTLSNNTGVIYLRYSDNNLLNNNSPVGTFTGVSLHYSDSNLLINNSANILETGFVMYHSDNNILTGNSISAGDYGLVLGYSHNNTVSNNTVGGCWEPIGLRFSSNNIVSNNYMSVADTAIFLRDSSNNNTVSNNYVRSASVAINLWSSSNNNTVSNNYVGHASPAVNLRSSSNNRVNNNTVNTGSTAFNLKDSNNNVLKDNIANNVDFGTKSSFCLESSNNNILTGNVAGKKKIQEGKENIHLNNSNSNLIYNNYFNSTNNVYDNGNNIWNITKTPGTNIVGGPFLGGNYWSDYEGIDTNWDGLGDTLLPYNSSGHIASGGDYLPLVTPAGPISAIQATVDINPGVLNPKSKGKWVTVYIELPACYDVNDIDVSTILLMSSLPAESASSKVGDGDYNGKPDLMVKFDRNELISLLGTGEVELMLTGKMTDGTMFEGFDSIQVLTKVK